MFQDISQITVQTDMSKCIVCFFGVFFAATLGWDTMYI